MHAYTAANEPYSLWQGVQRGSPEYSALKEGRSQVLWAALERVIPDIRDRTKLKLVGGCWQAAGWCVDVQRWVPCSAMWCHVVPCSAM